MSSSSLTRACSTGVIAFTGVYYCIMPKRLHLEAHLSSPELERYYRKARDPVERTHLHIIWQLSRGRRTREVAEATGYSPGWIREVARRYNAGGVAGLGDRRHHNPGGGTRALLSPEHHHALAALLEQPAADGGLWNSRNVAAWIATQIGKPVRVQRGWEYLRKLGYTPQIPRPVHAKADPDEQAAFKKSSPPGLPRSKRLSQR